MMDKLKIRCIRDKNYWFNASLQFSFPTCIAQLFQFENAMVSRDLTAGRFCPEKSVPLSRNCRLQSWKKAKNRGFPLKTADKVGGRNFLLSTLGFSIGSNSIATACGWTNRLSLQAGKKETINKNMEEPDEV